MQHLKKPQSGQADILLGTQMLAKGHHFPNVTLVAIIDADQGLFGSDFRSSERMAQQIVQVAGRSGRGDTPGEVIIQTHQPEHPLLLQLVSHGYSAFAKTALEERHLTQLPPVTHMAILRAESPQAESPLQFLEQAKQSAAPIINENTPALGARPGSDGTPCRSLPCATHYSINRPKINTDFTETLGPPAGQE